MRKLLFFGLIIVLTGCGTIMNGTTQEIGISSNPSQATVQINGQTEGTTPMKVDLKRKDTHVVRLTLDGYHPYELQLTRKASGWVWGNLVFGGLPGLAIDAITGGLYKITPEQVEADLKKQSAALVNNDTGFIVVVMEPAPSWKKIGQLQSD